MQSISSTFGRIFNKDIPKQKGTQQKEDKMLRPETSDSFVRAPSRHLKSVIGQVQSKSKNLIAGKLQRDFGEEIKSLPPSVFSEISQQAFGDKAKGLDQNKIPQAAHVQLVPRRHLEGADGAYSNKAGGTILLADDLNPAEQRATYREEAGHHLDATLGGPDSLGDEGAIFGAGVEGKKPLSELSTLKSAKDHGTLEIDGKTTPVEFRAYTATRAKRDAQRTAQSFVVEMNKHDRAWSAFTDGKISDPRSAFWSDIAAATNPTDPIEAGSVAVAITFARALSRGRAHRRLRTIGRRSGLNSQQQEKFADSVVKRAEQTRDGAEAASRYIHLLKN